MSAAPGMGLGMRRELVRWQRLLPVNGNVLVVRGRRVRPQDIVARAAIPGESFAVSVPELGSETEAKIRLLKQVGDKVAAGEPLAVKKGFLGREKAICVSPDEGVVEAVSRAKGFVVLGRPERTVELAAGVAGTVLQVVANRGALLEFSGLFGQGVAMVGDEAWGELAGGSDGPDGPLAVESDHAGRVVFGGRADDEAIAAASRIGARALIVGSVSASTWLSLQAGKVGGVAVLITEGVGTAPMAERTFSELRSAVGAPALVTRRSAGTRPAIVVSLEQEAFVEMPLPQLEQGAQVRVAAGPYAGRWGYVVGLPSMPRRTETGLVCMAADVALDGGEQTSVPVANLELVG